MCFRAFLAEQDIEEILGYVEMGKAQALLFSATTPTWINQMVKQFLKDPLRLDAASDGEARTATTVKQLPLSANPSPSLSLSLSLSLKDADTTHSRFCRVELWTGCQLFERKP